MDKMSSEKPLTFWVVTEYKNNILYEIDLVNLSSIQNSVVKNTKDLWKIAIKKTKIVKHFGEQITTLVGIRRKFLIGKAG